MKLLLALLLWTLLLALCWPLALLFLVAFPLLWLLSIPFRLVGSLVAALLAFVRALLFLPARVLGVDHAGSAARNATVRSHRLPAKYRSSTAANGFPAPPSAANNVIDERSFTSSGAPRISVAPRPSTASSAAAHSCNRGPSTGWAR